MKKLETRSKDLEITQRLVLRGLRVEELRKLAERHLSLDPNSFSASELREQLAVATEGNVSLRKELGDSSFFFKPSFYLMIANVQSDLKAVLKSATKLRQVFFEAINSKAKGDSAAPLKEFHLTHISSPGEGVLELQITWHQILHYLSVSATYQHVYALKAGFIFIDTLKEKALFCCHTTNERDILAKACKARLGITFSPITLTKQLLNNIGTFETVKRAAYFTTKPETTESQEVTYADDKLWKKEDAVRREKSANSARKHSFYRVDLGGLSDAGLGVTSDTAKFWISSETAVETTRDYGLLILKKFTSTLKKMKDAGDIPGILKVLAIDKSPALLSVAGPQLRQGLTDLAHTLVQMLLTQESERPFSPPPAFLTHGIPLLFNPARIQLHDEERDATGFWSNAEGTSQLVSFTRNKEIWEAREFASKDRLVLDGLRHPITGSHIAVQDPTRSVELLPTPKLHEVLLEIVKQVAVELPKLEKVCALPFYINAGMLVLNFKSSQDDSLKISLKDELDLATIRQFRVVLKQSVSEQEAKTLGPRLVQLKEKCVHMTDENCQNCLEQRKFLCLRSLLARFLLSRQLWMHKGIELSDLEGSIDVDGERRRVWFFSKLAQGDLGLTLRNSSGAILLAQIINQIDKSTFDVVGILTPSIVNQDLRERIVFLSGLMGKRVLIVRKELLEKMLMYFEEQNHIEHKNVAKIYSASRRKKISVKPDQAVGSFV